MTCCRHVVNLQNLSDAQAGNLQEYRGIKSGIVRLLLTSFETSSRFFETSSRFFFFRHCHCRSLLSDICFLLASGFLPFFYFARRSVDLIRNWWLFFLGAGKPLTAGVGVFHTGKNAADKPVASQSSPAEEDSALIIIIRRRSISSVSLDHED
ncbi:hypothetical protein BV898_06569 [Hypsibius exemplaris]|uniref:Uncharacterized protein n=1 Tax=Hypsibius exemplaris TaxID=2072580 RepID=A0A1W0WW16_HYPEX|nr:hypothetical protein BV898_06569 [Hypsibius exemplaris]